MRQAITVILFALLTAAAFEVFPVILWAMDTPPDTEWVYVFIGFGVPGTWPGFMVGMAYTQDQKWRKEEKNGQRDTP